MPLIPEITIGYDLEPFSISPTVEINTQNENLIVERTLQKNNSF
jgi:hypothetical protein